MSNLKSPQEIFIDMYYNATGSLDPERYYNAVTNFEAKYEMKRPFKSYYSFKTSLKSYREKEIKDS